MERVSQPDREQDWRGAGKNSHPPYGSHRSDRPHEGTR